MKKVIFILFFALFSFSVFAQDTAAVPPVIESVETIEAVELDSLGSDINNVVEFIQSIPKKIQNITAAQVFYNGLYMALVVILGYLSHLIPGLERITDTGIRVAVSAIVLGFIFVSNDLSSAFPLVLEFIVVSKVYDRILKGFKKTPTIEPKTATA